MKIEVLEDKTINENSFVSVKKMGHIYEICYTQHRNSTCPIEKIDKDYYMLVKTGEIRECEHADNRADNKLQVSQSLKRLRDYINTNVIEVNNCKWITLTYSENMTDAKRLYNDFKKFIKKFKYKYGPFEYIVAMEPQARGAWHAHCIIIFNKKAPYIPNKDIEILWGQGFTKTQKLDDIDNIGAYLTAYLGDMELQSCKENDIQYDKNDIKEIYEIGNKKLKTPKKFVKGGRLSMYPVGFNIYRISRGIKKPLKEYHPYNSIKEKEGLRQPTFSKAIQLTDSKSDFSNKIIYEYYNTKRV